MPEITPSLYTPRLVNTANATIPEGATKSAPVNCAGASVLAIVIPVGFTAGNITFSSSLTSEIGTFMPVRKIDGSGDAYTISGASAGHQPLDPAVFAGVQNLVINCANAQESDATLQVIMGPLWQ